MTAVCTDTLAQSSSVTISIVSVVSAAEDALPGLEVRFERTDVGLVHVVDDDGGHGDDLGRASGHDGHQDEEEHGVLSNRSKQLLSNKWGGETFHDILVRKKRSTLSGGETEVGEPHCGGKPERDCEPAETSGDETPDSLQTKGG